jgi:dephospho-CoA kinase
VTTLRIGLTGPIGCGKSTVGGWLAESGALLVDADAVARGVTAPGTRGHDAVLRAFGREVRAADGSLDRAKLASIVFSDPDRLRELEALVHPLVRPLILARIDDAERAGAPAVVIEAIRLVESGLAALCDEVWLVACGPDEQRRRLEGRGMDAHDAERRMAAQGDLADRLRAAATRVIDSSGPTEETRGRVAAALDEALGASDG